MIFSLSNYSLTVKVSCIHSFILIRFSSSFLVSKENRAFEQYITVENPEKTDVAKAIANEGVRQDRMVFLFNVDCGKELPNCNAYSFFVQHQLPEDYKECMYYKLYVCSCV